MFVKVILADIQRGQHEKANLVTKKILEKIEKGNRYALLHSKAAAEFMGSGLGSRRVVFASHVARTVAQKPYLFNPCCQGDLHIQRHNIIQVVCFSLMHITYICKALHLHKRAYL